MIRYIDDDPMARLKARARRKGVSLERQLRIIVTEAARLDASVAVKWVIPEVLSDGPIRCEAAPTVFSRRISCCRRRRTREGRS